MSTRRPSPDIGDRFLRTREVAELLAISQRQVETYIARGTLPAVRLGVSVRVRARDVLRILERGLPGNSPRGTS